MSLTTVANHLQGVRARIQTCAQANNIAPESLQLVAVSKRHPAGAIEQAYDAGQRHFGENYLQEALEKINELQQKDIYWHFIGPIQSNKTRPIAENFSWVHTLERLKIAERLSSQRPEALPPLNVCIQINIDKEDTKAGIAPNDAEAFAKTVAGLPNIRLRGLMAIPAKSSDGSSLKAMADLFENLAQKQICPHWDTLSMGMSADLEQAIEAGANMLRIGTDIFGARSN